MKNWVLCREAPGHSDPCCRLLSWLAGFHRYDIHLSVVLTVSAATPKMGIIAVSIRITEANTIPLFVSLKSFTIFMAVPTLQSGTGQNKLIKSTDLTGSKHFRDDLPDVFYTIQPIIFLNLNALAQNIQSPGVEFIEWATSCS